MGASSDRRCDCSFDGPRSSGARQCVVGGSNSNRWEMDGMHTYIYVFVRRSEVNWGAEALDGKGPLTWLGTVTQNTHRRGRQSERCVKADGPRMLFPSSPSLLVVLLVHTYWYMLVHSISPLDISSSSSSTAVTDNELDWTTCARGP